MMNQRIFESEMPELSLSKEELTTVIIAAIGRHTKSFNFPSLVSGIASELNHSGKGFTAGSYTQYQSVLRQQDKARIREIIWDLIISRDLTIGDFYNDEWPHLTITEKGQNLFHNKQR